MYVYTSCEDVDSAAAAAAAAACETVRVNAVFVANDDEDVRLGFHREADGRRRTGTGIAAVTVRRSSHRLISVGDAYNKRRRDPGRGTVFVGGRSTRHVRVVARD